MGRHLSNCCLGSFCVVQLGTAHTHTQATTFQQVDCGEKLDLSGVFCRSNRLSLQLNRPLRNTRITFAFCFGYFSIDVEELSL